MILKWIVKCDNCGRKIDATKERFVQKDWGELCEQCGDDVP